MMATKSNVLRRLIVVLLLVSLTVMHTILAESQESSDLYDTSPYHSKTSRGRSGSVIFDGEGDIFACQNAGICQECSDADLEKEMPYCSPYPHKQAISCHYIASAEDREEPLPTWRSCRRVPGLERWRFFEFTVCKICLSAIYADYRSSMLCSLLLHASPSFGGQGH